MAHVLLFHHALGLTEGVRAFAEDLRAAGHDVTTPDLYGGRTFAALDEGVAHARALGFGELVEAGVAAAEGLPEALVCGGFSLGLLPAEAVVLRRPGVRGALLYHGAVPPEELGGTWPDGVPLQLHVMADDPLGDVAEGEALAAATGGERFTYPGAAHLFTDRSTPDHDPAAAALVLERTLALLRRLDAAARG
jgi:dienelactone hydrolase